MIVEGKQEFKDLIESDNKKHDSNNFIKTDDKFINSLRRISGKGDIWRMHWSTYKRLLTVKKKLIKNKIKYRYIKGVLGEEYISREYIYPALRDIGYTKLKNIVRRRYKTNPNRNGDIDIKITLPEPAKITYVSEVKNYNPNYTLSKIPNFEDFILNPLSNGDRNHKYNWILFIQPNHIDDKVISLCNDNKINIIPVYVFVDNKIIKTSGEMLNNLYKRYNIAKCDSDLCIYAQPDTRYPMSYGSALNKRINKDNEITLYWK